MIWNFTAFLKWASIAALVISSHFMRTLLYAVHLIAIHMFLTHIQIQIIGERKTRPPHTGQKDSRAYPSHSSTSMFECSCEGIERVCVCVDVQKVYINISKLILLYYFHCIQAGQKIEWLWNILGCPSLLHWGKKKANICGSTPGTLADKKICV